MERNLNDETLLIADSNRGIALAGIMGGQNSEVSENTTDILLESAYFNPVNIRRSSKYLGLSTEASYRFERSADPEILKFASDRAADLIQEICGGKIAAGIIDEYPKKIQREPFLFRHQKAEKILGIKIPENRVSDIIEKLGMEIQEKTDSAIKVVPPSYRPDLTREIDIIEEVARIFGYPNIPTTYPSPSLYHKRKIEKTPLVSEIRNMMTGWGFSEVINYSFIDERVLEKLGITDKSPLCNFVRLKNPLSEEQNILRTTLIPGLLANLELNTKRFLSDIKIFETGKVFFSKGSAEQPEEKTCFSGLLSGEYESKSWMNIKRRMDFFDAKGIIEAVSKHFSVTLSFRKHKDRYKFLDSGKSAEIFLNSKPLGFLGELHPEIAERFEILQSVAVFEICLDELLLNTGTNPVYKPIPKNPPTYRDISIILPEASGFNEIMDIIRKIGGEVLEDVKIFDLFKGKQVPAGKKSMTFSLVFRNPQRTLTDKEVDDIRLNIINELNKKLGAELRT
ncbi:MAG: phenylalanine--tRNA ligase subunit beta [Candidatus Schekmanbacteria bacterium RIFCSPHIGHO2_02_FULL_38_11]|nr:MAG: phenylalanine--tRNA ligase subunit beta [Candidatus Schekmanbacteria bacterium RIFCSPHIGHO2_02_FULL_38_11]